MSEIKSYGLEEIRADGWLARLGEGSPSFGQLCDIVGERFVGFAVIAGVRIQSVAVDPRNRDASVVDFAVGEDNAPVQRLPLGEFRRRLSSALLGGDEPSPPLPDNPKADDLSAFIGFRYVLLSPLFGIGLSELRVGPGPTKATVVLDLGGRREEIALFELREVIRERIRNEAASARPSSPFSIDLNAVPAALKAAEIGDHDEVVELLGAWPGPLSMLLRTAEGAGLAAEVRATLARALGVLGTAYSMLGRGDWAQEVLRLGIQWAQESPVAGELFVRIGRAHVNSEREGEAIGHFRRALQLGAEGRVVLPLLASAFAARQRHLASLLLVDEAVEAGAHEAAVAEIRREAVSALGEPWVRFRHYMSE